MRCLQVFILDSLAGYNSTSAADAEKIAERVLPRLQHVNGAVVLSAVKVRPCLTYISLYRGEIISYSLPSLHAPMHMLCIHRGHLPPWSHDPLLTPIPLQLGGAPCAVAADLPHRIPSTRCHPATRR
jgi:hypothetical protein